MAPANSFMASINASRASRGVKAITSRRRLALFALRRPPSWQPVGFLADVAACFAKRGISMDLVSSSCSEIRVTLDLDGFEIRDGGRRPCGLFLARPRGARASSVSLRGAANG